MGHPATVGWGSSIGVATSPSCSDSLGSRIYAGFYLSAPTRLLKSVPFSRLKPSELLEEVPQKHHCTMAQQTALPAYEEEVMKHEMNHVEFGGAEKAHVDLHEIAAPGHMATDLYGHAIITIDKAASNRLARKVGSGLSRSWQRHFQLTRSP